MSNGFYFTYASVPMPFAVKAPKTLCDRPKRQTNVIPEHPTVSDPWPPPLLCTLQPNISLKITCQSVRSIYYLWIDLQIIDVLPFGL